MKTYAAELLGTFWLVFGGCGSAILAAHGIGTLGVSLAFGLAVLTAAQAFGGISGGHFNPAVTLGAGLAGRLPWARVPGYLVAQLLGATAAAVVLYLVASGHPDFDLAKGFAANGFGAHSPGGYGAGPAFAMEVVCTAFFIFVILAVTSVANAAAPFAIAATLTLIHLVLIPVTNASVNPARSLGPALIVGDWATAQLWLFWVAPLLGAVVGAFAYRLVTSTRPR